MNARAKLTIAAEYALLVQPFLSREGTRYYLRGFYVQPTDKGGALIVATDGHTMAIFHDESATVDQPGIIRLSKTTLAACITAKKEEPRVLVVDGERASVYRLWDQESRTGTALMAAQDDAVIDGTFPDWRHVVPAMPTKFGAAAINSAYLKRFERLSLGKGSAGMTAYAASATDPVLVLTDRQDFVGIVMPMRCEHKYPNWL